VIQFRRQKRKKSVTDIELGVVERPSKLQQELTHLISINPRDPSFYRESPKLAKRYIIYTMVLWV
jgi:hypothetical protein